MWNPVIFKDLKISWNAEKLLPSAERVYTRMEDYFSKRFYFPNDIVRVFPDNYTANEWDSIDLMHPLRQFMSDERDLQVEKQLQLLHGYGVVKQSGWLDVNVMLQAVRRHFENANRFREEKFDLSGHDTEEIPVIMCTGNSIKSAGMFNWLPIIPNKGQVLVIHAPGLNLGRMVNFGRFIIPLGNDRFKVGGIYEYEDPDPLPTKATADQLIAELRTIYKGEITIEEHIAGYRPTVNDRKPILGRHPQIDGLYIFNGLGSKGVMLAPYFAEMMTAFLTSGEKLPYEVDVVRHWNKRHRYIAQE